MSNVSSELSPSVRSEIDSMIRQLQSGHQDLRNVAEPVDKGVGTREDEEMVGRLQRHIGAVGSAITSRLANIGVDLRCNGRYYASTNVGLQLIDFAANEVEDISNAPEPE